MSKAKKCDGCGKKIGRYEDRVKLPAAAGIAMTYHVDCYCTMYSNRVLRALVNDEPTFAGVRTLGGALAQVLRALDPAKDEEDE